MSVSFEFDPDKTVAATFYIVSKKLPELTMAKLFKLLYFSDKDHLVRYGRPITGDCYVAMKDGPVPSNLYDLFKEIRNRPSSHGGKLLAASIASDASTFEYPRLIPTGTLDPMQLSVSDISSLDRIVEEYGRMTFLRLRTITHDTPAWENAWESRPPEATSNKMSFEDFFEDDANAIVGAKEEMIETFALKMALDDPPIF